MADRRVGVAVVTVDGSPLPPTTYSELIDARVEQSVHVPDRFSLRFRDPTFELVDGDTFGVGKAVEITVEDGQRQVSVIRGEVTTMAVEEGAGGRHELVVSGLDRGHRLARGPKVRTFTGQTDQDVVRAIASDAGLGVDIDDSVRVTYDYLLQRGTDYSFLGERARAIGFSWWVSGETLHFRKEPKLESGPTLSYGSDLVRFKVRASCAEAANKVVVRGWDPDSQEAIVASASMDVSDDAAMGTDSSLGKSAVTGAAKFGGEIERGTGSVGVRDVSEANALARSLATSATTEYVVARGEALGNPSLRAGTEVEVTGVGRRLSGHYLLTSVEHVLGAGRQYVTRFVSGGRHPDTLVDLLSGPPATTRAGWGEQGLVIGVVTNNKDPDGLGRVKVRYPTLTDSEESWWARVAAVGAGPQRGLSVLFEVGDEVLVAFEHGDMRRPLVLGGLWSRKHKPHRGGEETDLEGVASRVWRSRTGHVVEMYDSGDPAGSYVAITLADRRTRLRLGEDRVTLESPTDIAISSRGDIRLDATGDLTLTGANVEVKATNAVKIDGTTVAARGTATAKVEGGAQAELKSSGALTVQAGAVAALRGALVKLN